MKKTLSLILFAMLIFGLTACGSSTESTESPTSAAPAAPAAPLTDKETEMMYADPKSYKGSTVELVGQVFFDVERDQEGVYFQMYQDPEGAGRNTIVAYFDPDFNVHADDYVRIKGVVNDEIVGENMMGAEVRAPSIIASSVEVISYQDAVSPTMFVAEADPVTIEQHGYAVTIQKVELSRDEARVYVRVENNGSSTFNLSEYNTIALQDSKQMEQQSNYGADYPELQRDIRPGVVSEGIITLSAIGNAPFKLILDGYSDNWDEDIEEFVFNCTIVG